MKSDFLSIKAKDFLKGLIMAVGTPVLYFVQEWIPAITMHPILKVAVAAFVTYLLKNFFTDSVGEAQKTVAKAREESIKAV